jgi:hypothetical protein
MAVRRNLLRPLKQRFRPCSTRGRTRSAARRRPYCFAPDLELRSIRSRAPARGGRARSKEPRGVVLDLEGLDRIRRSQQSITAGDDVAFSHNLNRMRATNRDGEQTELWFRQTMYFCKIDGDWKIRARARLLIVSVHQRPRLKPGALRASSSLVACSRPSRAR